MPKALDGPQALLDATVEWIADNVIANEIYDVDPLPEELRPLLVDVLMRPEHGWPDRETADDLLREWWKWT